ncbi:toxin co-regulated pilus biosynthesis Q family protein [Roseateles amylovorans]|uniref:Toxin co-regulated pilus biosynthesis Q family protein n=1 Tax=Roseateles amylovorans TaxID=2978473 RepID=A0ABY6B4G9_9BURK|nr:toxin co-regulated pilus biosynthesis Q family protein [Roseateles amylovorans]UXH80278.1 toxin co-regulated pilus biosynthesis Q family protein [Roseateles amylovorans]
MKNLHLLLLATLATVPLATRAANATPNPAAKAASTSAPHATTPPEPRGYAEVEWVRTPRARVPASVAADGDEVLLKTLRAESSGEWTVELADQTFRQTLLRWTRIAGWQLVWEADRDFAIDAQVTLQGNFTQVLEEAMNSLRETDYPVQALINPNTRVVRVKRYMLDGDRR